MPFKNRWRIDGTLTTRSQLHIGSGEVTTRKGLVVESREDEKKKKEPIQIAAVATDHNQRAYIPGKALKGVLRSWLDQSHIDPALIEQVFGSAETGEAINAYGGKAEFGDVFGVSPEVMPQVPYPCDKRLTGVGVSVAIKRQTRTAYPKKLFHKEFVPPGIDFDVTITGQDLEPAERDLLVYALEQFNHADHAVVIGAETGNGFGRCTWTLREIACLDKDNIDAWLTHPAAPVGYAGYPALSDADRQTLVADAKVAFQPEMAPSLMLTLAIHFDGPFLVNDPSQYQAKEDPDHIPFRDYLGRVVLPASSIRGALRSQAERIVRTFELASACHVTDSGDACPPIYHAEQRSTELCLTCQVFGAPGWNAPVSFSDFVLVEDTPEIPFHQEFLAIDRFTGGGADGLKFDAEAVYQPTLHGAMTIDLQRVDPWALGLLALLLRDLVEGDIVLGFGAAKGYGACRAAVTGLRATSLEQHPELWDILQTCEAAQIDWNGLELALLPTLDFEYIATDAVIEELLKTFQKKLNTFARQAS